ncbi:MAG: DUF5662 family protein [Lachnospiraceae bacterium]|nr:DUF5662 family protein [Lachnospiraceae bacterium]
MIRSTLCYIKRDSEYLMLLRNRKAADPNEGKWIGVGGKIEAKETPTECMLREVFEETGIKLSDYEYKGVLNFRSDKWEDEEMHLFTANVPSGTGFVDCNEGTLKWIPESEILSLPLWEGDKLFLREILEGRKEINMSLIYRGDKLVTACDNYRFSRFKAFFLHFKTITRHRHLVMKGCFKVGLYKQGLLHDLSKYSFTEFREGVKYYQGHRSPNVAERMDKGYSEAWMHHKGRNKHHFEYWSDYSIEPGERMVYMRMPRRYFVESVMDRIAACKVYKGKTYTDSAAYEYLTTRDSEGLMNPADFAELKRILKMLADKGEKETCLYLKNVYLKGRE